MILKTGAVEEDALANALGDGYRTCENHTKRLSSGGLLSAVACPSRRMLSREQSTQTPPSNAF